MKKTKTAKRLLAMLFVLALLAGFVPITASATEYNGETETGSYTISTVTQLQQLANAVSGGTNYHGSTFTLTADLDLSSVCGAGVANWTPIGTSSNMFMGTFDGGGHTISNLYYNDSATDNIGLFGYTQAAVIKTIRMTGVDITGGTSVGGVVGYANSNTEISACHVSGSLAGNQSIGGIAGVLFGATATNCYTAATIMLGVEKAGGITGILLQSSGVSNCYAVGSVTSAGGSYVGGIAGEIRTIIFSGGTVSNSVALLEAVSGVSNVGRVVGAKDVPHAVSGCRAWDGMTVNGSPVSASGAADINGADLTATAALAGTTYSASPLSWDAGTWTMGDNALPYVTAFEPVETEQYAYLTAPVGDTTKPVLSNVTAGPVTVGENISATTNEDGTLYLVPSATGATKAELDTAAATDNGTTAAANADTPTILSTIGFSAGAYIVYAVDGSDNVSDPSAEISVNENAHGSLYNTMTNNYDSSYNSEETALEIASAQDLQDFAVFVNEGHNFSGKFAKLTSAEINLSSVCGSGSGNWTPIGTSSNPFCGTFDGCGNEIANLYYDGASDSYVGLFGSVGNSSVSTTTIENVRLTGVDITAAQFVGGIFGYCPRGAVSACYVEGDINAGGATFNGSLAGLVGSNASFAGGIGGSTNTDPSSTRNISIKNCYTAVGLTSGANCAGGIIGFLGSGCSIENSYASGTINAGGSSCVGGVTGISYSVVKLQYSVALQSSIICGTDYVGRVTGYDMYSPIFGTMMKNCYAYEGMTGITVSSGTNVHNGINGIDLTAAQALSATIYSGLPWTVYDTVSAPYGWVIEDGALPHIYGYGEVPIGGLAVDTLGIKKIRLAADIADAEALRDNTAASTDGQDISKYKYWALQSVKDTFNTAITLAREVRDNDSSTLEQVSAQIEALQTAVTNFNTARQLGSKYIVADELAANYDTAGSYSTPETALKIDTAENLKDFADFVNEGTIHRFSGKYVKLTADIDLSTVCGPSAGGDSWTPIGKTTSTGFNGTFDGCGYTVENLYIDASDSSPKGLFGFVNYPGGSTTAGIIKNIMLKKVDITVTNGYTGGLVGSMTGGNDTYRAMLSNCTVTGSIQTTDISDGRAGGIAGSVSTYTDVSNCSFSGTVSLTAAAASASYCGGILGYTTANNNTFSYCYATGSVSTLGAGAYTGGIIGYAPTNFAITGCFALQLSLSNNTGTDKVGRVLGAGSSAASGCNAWEGMTVNGYAIAATDATSKDGSDISATDALTGSTYSTAGWSSAVWTLTDGILPYITAPVDTSLYTYLKATSVKLSAPTGLAWDGTTPGKATWSAVANASSYTVQLLKDGVTSGSAVTGITVTEYDFTSAIASAGTGSYTFTVTAIGDGTNYTDSDAATVGTAYSYTSPAVKLSAPTGLAWDGTTPGKATWSAVANASSYTVQLLKDGVTSGSAVTGITVTEYDFTSAIASAGTGSYTFTVTAIGDGTNYTDSDAATVGTAYSYTSPAVKLSAPTGLAWDGTTPGKATWSAVANASSYTVQLLKDGVTSGSAVTGITVTEYDFTSAIASAGTGSYTFTVTTSGDGTNYTDSDAATVGTAYSYTSPAVKLSAPTGLAWDGTTPGKATWSAVANVSSYTVQLLKDGVTSGSAVTGITVTEYDITSAIASAGTGSYTFTVTAIGDGTNYTDSDAATVGTAYSYTSPAVKLSAPIGLAWDGTTPGKATWSAVANASSYTVQLLKDGVTSGSAVTGITVIEYDFTSAIASAGTGSYTFTVTTSGDGTNYTDSDAATVGTAYSYTSPAVKLSAPTGLAWDGTTPGKATWSAVANASSYTVQLLKDGVMSGSAVTGITVIEYDFTSAIASAGTGSYTFTVTTSGDGTNYTDSDAATVGTAYSYTSPALKLSAPTGLVWDGTTPGKATWSAVANASGYTVQLLKDGVTSGSAVTGITVIEYDFTSAIASAGTGSYTFTVTTSGDGTNYTDSDAATVGTAYSYTSPAGPDTTSPTLTNAYVSNKSATGATINFTSDEAGTYYYVVYLATEAAPDAGTVKTGTSGAAVAGANSFNATGLAASTAYTAYVIVTDAANNTSTVADIDFTTTVAYYPGGTGGGSGNGATTGSATSNTVNPGATSSNGTVTAQVSESSLSDTIKYAQENNSGSIVIAPEITGSASTVNVVIPGSSLMEIASQTKANLVLDTPAGSMTIPNNTLASVASQAAGGSVTMSLGTADTSALTPEQQSAVGSDPVYDISIMSGGENISSFGGASLTITLPYTLQPGEDPAGVSVWYLNDAGELAQMPCTYDAATGTVSFSTDHLSYYVIAYNALAAWVNPYGDVRQTDWFYDAVAFVSADGLFTGTGASVFSPDTEMTRTMLVTVLYRLEGEPRVSGTSAFTDVKDGMWYTDAVVWANANGIVTGYDNGLFGTDDSITREQMAAILYRYAQFKGYDVTAEVSLTAYTDSMDLSDWAGAAMRWANAEELITGMTSDALVPGGSATRAQVATILMRFAERFAG